MKPYMPLTYFLALAFALLIPAIGMGQSAEYNNGNNYVNPASPLQTGTDSINPNWGKLINMNFINGSSGKIVNNGAIWFKGDFQNDGVVDYDQNLSLTPGLSRLEGTTAKTISGSGNTRFYRAYFSAPSFSLEQNITISKEADFTQGILHAKQTNLIKDPANTVTLEQNATCYNVSDVSHVDGYVIKQGAGINGLFTFPIGNDGYYRPATLSGLQSTNNQFRVRYVHDDPEAYGFFRDRKDATVGEISNKEFWYISRIAGTDDVQVTLTWDVSKTSAPMSGDLTKITIIRWDYSKWVREESVAVSGDASSGSITAKVSGNGPLALGFISAEHSVAVNDTISVLQGNTVTGNVANNDTISSTSSNWSIVTQPKHGSFSLQSNGIYTYTADADYAGLDSATYALNDGTTSVTAKVIIHIIEVNGSFLINKTSTVPQLQTDGTFIWKYYITITNKLKTPLDSIQVTDTLTKVFPAPITFEVTNKIASGGLTINGLYDGINRSDLLIQDQSSVAVGAKDSIVIDIKADPHKYIGEVYNQAIFNGTCKAYGNVTVLTDDTTNVKSTATRRPTITDIPKIDLEFPNGFSPNGDGVNDAFVIAHTSDMTIKLEIFNRWGQQLYKNNDYQNDWTGKGTGSLLGTNLLDGTYYYMVTATNNTTGEVTKYSGFVTLKR